MMLRERTPADLEGCVRLAEEVHDRDGYPGYLPTDIPAFVAEPDAYAAWVVERCDEIIGHAALHHRAAAPVLELAGRSLGQPTNRLGVVARLFVSPDTGRLGVGRSLLDTAAEAATARGLWPILDVVTGFRSAVQLYERCGWVLAGRVSRQVADGTTIDELVYLGPAQVEGPGAAPDIKGSGRGTDP